MIADADKNGISDTYTDTILDCFRHASERDAVKRGEGSRSTREVADWIDLPLAATRKCLCAMADGGLIDEIGQIDGLGNAVFWRALEVVKPEGEPAPLPVAA